MKKVPLVQTLDRAIAILNLFTVDKPSRRLTDISEETGLHPSIVYRLLSTWEHHRFLVQDQETKQYRLGLRILELGNIVNHTLELKRLGLPVMKRLAEQSDESVVLSIVDEEDFAVCIERLESPQPVKFTATPGSKSWLHAGATGKVLLAYLPEERISRVLNRALPCFTEKTITDPDAIRQQLRSIRELGYAHSIGEMDPGVFAVAVPIFDYHKQIVGAITLAGPSSRWSETKLPKTVELLKESAAQVTAALQVGTRSRLHASGL